MDVAFADHLLRPRCLILEVHPGGRYVSYTTVTECGFGVGSHSDASLRTLDEWLIWIDRFADDLTGRQLREAKEAARAPFTEHESWTAFRERYARTSIPWTQP